MSMAMLFFYVSPQKITSKMNEIKSRVIHKLTNVDSIVGTL